MPEKRKTGILRRTGRGIARAYYFVVRLVLLAVVVVLYASLIASGVFLARGSYLFQFYLILIFIPPTVGALFIPFGKGEDGERPRKRWLPRFINATLIVALLATVYTFFRGILTWYTFLWVLATAWVVTGCYSASAKLKQLTPIHLTVTSLLRLAACVLIGLWFWNTEAARFHDTDVPAAVKIPIESIPGVSELTKQVMAVRADVIVDPFAYGTEDGSYLFRLAPIRPSLFSSAV